MANTVTNVTAGKPAVGGAVYVSALTTSLPTNASSAIGTYSTFAALGYCSEDGLTNANSRESEDIKAWGGDTVLSIQSDKTDTFSFTLIESLNMDVLKAFYGDDNVTGTLSSGIVIKSNSKELTEHSWVVDMILRNNVLKRIVIPSGKVTATEDIEYSDDAVTGLGITITAYPDSAGNTHYEYIVQNSSTT